MSGQIKFPECALCQALACSSGLKNKAPDNCPMVKENILLKNSLHEYEENMVQKLACTSALVEAEGYCNWTRIEEIIAFSRRSNFNRIGLAFCIGLRREAKRFSEIMTQNGFEMISAICKAGSVPKEELGLKDKDKVKPGRYEAMCNPVGQAKLLNKAGVDLKIILGLCVGHDSLFIQYAESPITVLAVKDRVLAHNPLGALYARHYFDKRFK